MTEKKEPADKPAPDPASPVNPSPLVSSFDQLKEAAAEAAADSKKKG